MVDAPKTEQMAEPSDDQADRAIKVCEGIVEVLAAEADTDLAAAGLAMALSWLATTRSLNEADALMLVSALGEAARDQVADLYAQALLQPEAMN